MIYNWEQYFWKSLLKSFSKKYGVDEDELRGDYDKLSALAPTMNGSTGTLST